jgi:hypothetical protein
LAASEAFSSAQEGARGTSDCATSRNFVHDGKEGWKFLRDGRGGSAEKFGSRADTGKAVEAFGEWAAFDNGASNGLNSANITQKFTGLGGASKAANSVSRANSAIDHRECRFCYFLHRPC